MDTNKEKMPLTIKAKESCRWDLVSLGEVMLRFDPGDRRIWTTRAFEVSEGGGEYLSLIHIYDLPAVLLPTRTGITKAGSSTFQR